MRSLLRVAAIVGALLLPLAAQAQKVESPAPSAAAVAQEQALQTAMESYAAKAVEVLAASALPRERWIAGMMLQGDALRAAEQPNQAAALRARSQQLLDGAIKAGRDDTTLLFWAMLDPPVNESEDPKVLAVARSQIAERLRELEPDNAVVWLGTLPARDAPGAIPVAIEVLGKAAAAQRFDTHFAKSMRALISAFEKVPPPKPWPDTRSLPGWEGVQPADVQVVMAVGVASALAMPYLVATQWWCTGNSAEHPWMEDCRKLAQIMITHSDSIVPHSLGLGLVAQLYPAESEQAKKALAQRRELAWVIENGMQKVGPGQPVSFATWRGAWAKPDATELSVARAALKAQGLAMLPPADFVPAWD